MKKLALVMMALALSTNLVACGGDKTTASTATPASTAAPAPASTAAPTPTSTEAPASTEAPETTAEETTEEELVFELDYDQIASWVDGGFIGTDDFGSPVVMAVDTNNEYAIIIFGDNSDMTAASFIGEITYEGDFATITDEVNELSLTFGVAQITEDTLELDMGEEIGNASIQAATTEEVLEVIKIAIDNYKHVA